MARNWEGLSDNYRNRLEGAGIDREAYMRGDSLSEARGHGFDREAIIDRIQEQKIDMYGGKDSFNPERSRKAIDRDTETGEKRSKEDLKKILKAYQNANNRQDLMEELDEDDLGDADKYH